MRSRRWKFAASLGLLLCLSASIAVGGFAADASVAEQGYPGGGGVWPDGYPPRGSFEYNGHYYFQSGWTKEAAATCVSAEKWVNKCVWTYWDGSQCGEEWVEWWGKKDPNNHVNTETRNQKKATCTEEGYTGDLYCKDCNKCLQKGETIPKTDHKWDKGQVTTKPTCTEPGVKTYTCTVCKTTKTETIDKTGHDPIAVPGKEPTCTETGLTEGSKCKRCEKILTAQETIPALGHKKVVISGQEPTCEADGWTESSYCERCKETLKEKETIPALGHDPIAVPGKEPTCTETGLTEGSKCKRCEKILTAQETIPALGHEEVVISGQEPTCEAEGWTESSYCKRCNVTLKAKEIIPAQGHDPIAVPGKEPTCTETGLTEGSKCQRCGKILTAQETIPALGHDWNTTSTGVDNCVNVSFRHENETITLCPICGVQNGTQRLNKVTLYTAHAKLVVLRGVLENGMEAMTVAFYEPGISSVTACQRCGAVRDSFSSGASLPQAAENAHFTVDASLVDGYTVMLVQADGTETVLTPGISNGKAIFDVDMKGQGARLLHLVPTTAA